MRGPPRHGPAGALLLLAARLGAAGAAAPAPAVPLKPEMQEILDRHNYYRCLSHVPSLKWDPALAAGAQAWANAGQFVHATGPDLVVNNVTVGELLGWAYERETPTEAVQRWYDEIKHTPNGGLPRTPEDSTDGQPINAYTQVVWEGTKTVGCGKNRTTRQGFLGDFWVCRYAPAGNIPDQYDDNVGGPINTPDQCKTKALKRIEPTPAPSSSATGGSSGRSTLRLAEQQQSGGLLPEAGTFGRPAALLAALAALAALLSWGARRRHRRSVAAGYSEAAVLLASDASVGA